jgi:hypothetical protein
VTPADVLNRRAKLAEAQRRALLAATEAGAEMARLDADAGIYDADALHRALVSVGAHYAGSVASLEDYVRCGLGGGAWTPGPWTRGEVERAVMVPWPRGVARVVDACDAVIRAREETER